jgi:MFS family permease
MALAGSPAFGLARFADGLNQVAGIAGSFIGLVLGGVLGPIGWRYVFLVSVPFGVLGTVWSYLKLRELGVRRPASLDWWGNVTFGCCRSTSRTGSSR